MAETVVLAPAGYDVNPSYGSDPERPWRLVQGLSRRGVRVIVVARRAVGLEEFGPGVSVRLLPGRMPTTLTGRLLDRVTLYLYARRVALDEIRGGSVLAVHHVSPCGPLSPSLLPRLPVPLVYGPMPGAEAVASREGWAQWLGVSTSRRYQRAASKLVGLGVTPVARYLWRRTMRIADAVTVEAAVNVPAERPDANVIPMGLDLTLFSPPNSRGVPGRAVTAGVLLPRKGIDVAIEAVARVRQDLPATHLMIAGDGPELARLRQLAKERGVDSAVTFLGRVPRDELADLYRSASVFCHPARSDNFPTVVIEAMACGLPILSSDAGALPEMVGQSGLTHRRGDIEALSEHLRAVLSDSQRQHELSAAARERAINVYSMDSMCDSYVKLYTELWSRKQRATRVSPQGVSVGSGAPIEKS